MAKTCVLLVGLLGLAACGSDTTTPLPTTSSAFVKLFPADGAGNVSVAARVQATIDRVNGDACRFSTTNTTVSVSRDGLPVAGAVVTFVDGLRVDFTPSGMFEFSATYTVRVEVPCSDPAQATFTTAGPQAAPGLAAGDGFKTIDLLVSEPTLLASVLQQFLTDANIVFQVLAEDASSLLVLAGESDTYPIQPAPRVFMRDSFYFPMTGVYKPPYFQIEGSLTIPVDTSEITLERFEISGRFFGTSPTVEIAEGNIRASSTCDTICQVDSQQVQGMCGSRSLICDGNGNLNLIGTYAGAPNDLAGWQVIDVTPADGATAVPTDATVSVSLTRAVNEAAPKAIVVELWAPGAAAPVAGTMVPAAGGLAGTFTPSALLAPNTTYTVRVVAHAAKQTTFSTGS